MRIVEPIVINVSTTAAFVCLRIVTAPITKSAGVNGDVPGIVEKRVVLLRQIYQDLLCKKTKTQENTLEETIRRTG